MHERGGQLLAHIKADSFWNRFGPEGILFKDVKAEDYADAKVSGGDDKVRNNNKGLVLSY